MHYAPIPPSVKYGLINGKQKLRKIKIGINIPQGTSKWTAMKRSKIKVTGPQKSGIMSTYRRQFRHRRLHTRPTPLLSLVQSMRCLASTYMLSCLFKNKNVRNTKKYTKYKSADSRTDLDR